MDRMSTLPTIKCSSCGVEISILHLADHVCAPSSQQQAASHLTPTNPPRLDSGSKLEGPSFSDRSNGQAPAGRMPPPARIDPNAANKPYHGLEILSQPLTPSATLEPPPKSLVKVNRSATTPPLRPARPTSLDLPPNMDSAFPSSPTQNPVPLPPSGSTPQQQQQYLHAEPSPIFAPLSPRLSGGINVSRRTGAMPSSPFDAKSSPSTSTPSRSTVLTKSPAEIESPSTQGHGRTGSANSYADKKNAQKRRSSWASNGSRSSTYSNGSINQPLAADYPEANLARSPPISPEESWRGEGIDAFLNRLQDNTMDSSKVGYGKKSRPTSSQHGSREIRNLPSSPRLQPQRPSEPQLSYLDPSQLGSPGPSIRSESPYQTNAPIRSELYNGNRLESTTYQSPQLVLPAAPAFEREALQPSLHTPSDSGISDDSFSSFGIRSVASSRSSPATSVIGNSQDTSRNDGAMSRPDIQSMRGPRSYARPNGPQEISRSLSPTISRSPLPAPAYPYMPKSPMDPAIVMGGAPGPTRKGPSPSRGLPLRGTTPTRPVQEPESRPAELRRAKTSKKGNCRGCSEPILGKSVKDSSGGLTGRYHKECFVCKTCGDEFPTAEFYVFENSPYCHYHYHRLNRSLCSSCDRGIEGQYLETDSRQKFHPRCFTCRTCRIVLRNDYFEVGGQKFCQRHAQYAANPGQGQNQNQNNLGPGSYQPRNIQKRRTRMMMMPVY